MIAATRATTPLKLVSSVARRYTAGSLEFSRPCRSLHSDSSPGLPLAALRRQSPTRPYPPWPAGRLRRRVSSRACRAILGARKPRSISLSASLSRSAQAVSRLPRQRNASSRPCIAQSCAAPVRRRWARSDSRSAAIQSRRAGQPLMRASWAISTCVRRCSPTGPPRNVPAPARSRHRRRVRYARPAGGCPRCPHLARLATTRSAGPPGGAVHPAGHRSAPPTAPPRRRRRRPRRLGDDRGDKCLLGFGVVTWAVFVIWCRRLLLAFGRPAEFSRRRPSPDHPLDKEVHSLWKKIASGANLNGSG